MDGIRRIIREVHRRSIWQVLAVYLAGSWVALQVVDALTRTAGLPDWVPPFAIVLLVIGLPVVLGTAIVQEGAPVRSSGDRAGVDGPGAEAAGAAPAATHESGPAPTRAAEPRSHPSFLRKHLTWKRAILGGVAAFALLGFAVTAYFAMRVAGVGPVASLVAQGVLEEREPILLAEFRNATSDPGLGSVVTEALRVDLASSRVVSLVEPSQVQEALRRMERSPDTGITPEVAREIAIRDAIKAVLEGEVGAAGSGFILTATLRGAADGATLATFRRTAAGPDAVIQAIDRLSQDVRERVGESLRSIRSGPPLWQVTTSSLEALRKYSQAEQALTRGDEMGALALLREATVLDPAFAMAYRKEAAVLGNLGIDRTREREAVEEAYRHRERLPEKERYLTDALYHHRITGDIDAMVRAYEATLRIDPFDPVALNNLANQYQFVGEYGRAEELYRRGVEGPWRSPVSYQNLIHNQLFQAKRDGALEALAVYGESYPEDPRVRQVAVWVHVSSGDLDGALREVDLLIEAPGLTAVRRAGAFGTRGHLLAAQGRLNEARAAWASAIRISGEVAPGPEQERRLWALWGDVAVSGDTVRGREMLDEFVRSGVMERAPPEARAYPFFVEAHLTVNEPERALEALAGWRRDLPADLVTPMVRAEQAYMEIWARSGRDDPEAVLQALLALQRDQRWPRYMLWELPWLLERTGRTREARDAWLRLLERPEAGLQEGLVLLPAGLERTGMLSEELGDRDIAVDAYRGFVELWTNADPDLQPRVTRARERLAALGAAG
jgi:eukaryotic-like serine/threonine-protein kinase